MKAPTLVNESSINPSDSASNVGSTSGKKSDKAETSKKHDGFFDPRSAIKKGKCGYQHCGKAIDKNGVDDTEAISCAKHHETWSTGYRYDTETQSQVKYGSNLDYQNCFNNGHATLHSDEEKEFPVGTLETGLGSYQRAERGFWCLDSDRTHGNYWLIDLLLNLRVK